MTLTQKTENGIAYRIERRDSPSIAENVTFWRGSDGSILELTEEEKLARDTSRSIVDPVDESTIGRNERTFGDN